VNWEYLHPFVENDRFTLVGDDGACPYFWPIGDKHILLFFSHMSGGQYFLGDYDTQRDKLIATSHGKFNFGAWGPCGVHAPSACPDGEGGVIVIFNMNPGYPSAGWDQIMTLPRRLTLTGPNQLAVEPAGEIESLRTGHRHIERTPLPANESVVLDGIAGNAMELTARIDPKNAATVEIDVLRSPDSQEYTRISFFANRGYRAEGLWQGRRNGVISLDMAHSSVLPGATSRPPEVAQVPLAEGELLELRVFIDRSVVEVFANGKQCVAVRVYPGREDSTGVSLCARGADAELLSLDAWQMKSIY
jgi:beta-fructofuranosidase